MPWKVIIDNGADYCAVLPHLFATEQDAHDAGHDWLTEFRHLNSIALEDDDDPSGYLVVPTADEEPTR